MKVNLLDNGQPEWHNVSHIDTNLDPWSPLLMSGPWNKVDDAVIEIVAEYNRARAKHGPMRGPHEGYAVLLEEVDELWDEIKANDPVKARKEIIQVAAMALAFLLEVSPQPEDFGR